MNKKFLITSNFKTKIINWLNLTLKNSIKWLTHLLGVKYVLDNLSKSASFLVVS